MAALVAAGGRGSGQRYGRIETVHLAQVTCIWHGSVGNTPGRCVLVRELGSTKAYDLAPFGVPSAPHRRQARSTAGWNTLTTGEREPGDVDRSAADDAELPGASASRRVGRLGGVPSQAGLGPNMSAARLAAVATSRSPADAFFKRVVGWRVLRPCDTDPGPRCSRVRLARAFSPGLGQTSRETTSERLKIFCQLNGRAEQDMIVEVARGRPCEVGLIECLQDPGHDP